MKKSPRNNLGFTLIEIIVVIAILGVLSVVLIAVINPLKQLERTRDSARKNDLAVISRALEGYAADYGGYPDPDPSDHTVDSSSIPWLQVLVDKGYLKSLPKDPKQIASLLENVLSQSQTYRNIKIIATLAQNVIKNETSQKRPTQKVAAVMTSKWTPFMRGADQFITDLSVDPINADHAYISIDVTPPRITRDAGNTWYPPYDTDFPIHPNNFNSWSILVSPHSTASNKVIFTAGSDGLIYRSTDGDNWQRVFDGPNVKFGALAADPNNANIYYAASANVHDFSPFVGNVESVRVCKSLDGGSTWNSTNCALASDFSPAMPNSDSTFSIEVKPGNSNVVFAPTENGLYKSTNGGASFTRVTVDSAEPGAITSDTFIDPDSPDKMWVTVNGSGAKGVYFSADGGSSWNPANAGLTSSAEYRRLLLVKHRDNTRKLYVTNGSESTGGSGGLWATGLTATDGVVGWTKLTNWGSNIPVPPQTRGLYYIAVSKANPDRLWASMRSGNVYRSDDKGANWQWVAAKLVNRTTPEFGTDEYVQNTGISLEGAEWITPDPADSTRIYLGDTDHALYVSVDSGQSARGLFKGPGASVGNGAGVIAVDPSDRNKLYLGTFQRPDVDNRGGVYYSTNRGNSFTLIGGSTSNVNGLPNGNVFGLQVDKSSPANQRALIIAIDGKGLYRGKFNGSSWSWQAFGLNTSPGPGLTDLETDWADSKRMYAIGPGGGFLNKPRAYPIDNANSGIYRCDDITVAVPCNWIKIDSASVKGSTPDAVAIDKLDPRRIYSIGNTGVWTTPNARAASVSWSEIKLDLSSVPDGRGGVAIAEGGISVLYVASLSKGILRSEGLGAFTLFNDVQFTDPGAHTHDLGRLRPRNIDYDPSTKTLFVSTEGGGSYKLQLVFAPSTPTPTSIIPSPTPTPGLTPIPSPAISANNYLYEVSEELNYYELWSSLENEEDPHIYTKPGAKCNSTNHTPPTPPPDYNYCVASDEG